MDAQSESWFRQMLGLNDGVPLPDRLVAIWERCALMQRRIGANTILSPQTMGLIAILAGAARDDGQNIPFVPGEKVSAKIDGTLRTCTLVEIRGETDFRVRTPGGKVCKVKTCTPVNCKEVAMPPAR